jgi:NAD(P)-dependent dehydrogenase (short-subunit alcohol dehydrogenase family)
MQLDLGDLSSIRTFVQEFQAKFNKLDILVNNAGALLTDGKMHKTKDGFEYHIGINHLGPFLLTRLLLSSLKKGESSK